MVGSSWRKIAIGSLLALAGLVVVQTADSQSSQVKVWKEGDVLTADDLNASLRAASGGQGGSAAPYVWSGYVPASQERGDASSDGHVATFNFASPVDGFALVSAQAEIRIRNKFDRGPADCTVSAMIAQSPGFPGCAVGETCAVPGYMQTSVNANLPTQSGGGLFLGVHQSMSRVLPIVRGNNTVYLNGRTDCPRAVWGAVTMTAIQVQSGGQATLTIP